MREIKFRAWNKKEKKYYYNSMEFSIKNLDDNYNYTALGISREEYVEKHQYIGFNALDMLFWDIEQYTGLKDKNGKEIYEGDIIKHTYFEEPIVVAWDNEWHGFNLVFDARPVEAFPFNSNEIEIISNIHES